MKTLPFCLGMVQASEQELARSFGAMALKHSSEFEMHQSCRLFHDWCREHLEKLETFATREGAIPNPDPTRVRKALFHGPRIGGYGLVRDLQDLLLLAHQAQSGWTALLQAAKAMPEAGLTQIVLECASQTDRQIEWLCAHLKVAAPQALTVPADLASEAKNSVSLPLKLLLGLALAAGIGLGIRRLRPGVA
jgi:hypothetical protein